MTGKSWMLNFAARLICPVTAASTASTAASRAREVLSPRVLSDLEERCLIAHMIGKGHVKSGNKKYHLAQPQEGKEQSPQEQHGQSQSLELL